MSIPRFMFFFCRHSACLMALCLFALAPAAAKQPEAYPPLPIELHARRIADSDVYYVMGQPAVPDADNVGYTANAGFVVTGQGVVVFDALGTPALGKALIDVIREHTEQPIRFVVVSHYHADHMYGLQAFRDATSATIVAQNETRKYAGSLDANKRLAQRRDALAPWVNRQTRIVAPELTFDNRSILTVGDKLLQLVYAGPAHAPGDSMMLVKPDNVLFAGDIVQNHRIPFMDSDAVDTSNWLQGLDSVLAMQPAHIIPGHGKASDNPEQAIQFTGDYIRYVRARMKKAVANWQSFEQAYGDTDWSDYRALPAFDATNRGNAYRVYLEMQSQSLD